MLGWKMYNTVIMDASSRKNVENIVGTIDMMTNRRIGKSKARKLDRNRPSIRVVKRFTTANRYREAKLMLEEFYPGMCAFDVPM